LEIKTQGFTEAEGRMKGEKETKGGTWDGKKQGKRAQGP